MIVVDASVLVDALVGADAAADEARSRLASDRDLHVPHLVDMEVASSIRGLRIANVIDETRAVSAIDDLQQLDLSRYPHGPLLRRVWELHRNLTAYDAVYVALAEALETVLVTCDARIARASGLRCNVQVLGNGNWPA